MPATAGRVRMPANNRVHSSRALQTHSIWQSAIGYDPYAPESESKSQPDTNAYSNFQGLLALAKVTTGSSSNGIETRGACKKCGRLGHLTYQCRNLLSFNKEDENKEFAGFAPDSTGMAAVREESQSSDSDSDSDSYSDSSVDPEIERIIEERYGKKFSDSLRGRSKIGESHSRRSPSRTTRRKYFDSDSDSDHKSKRYRRRRAIDSSSDSHSKSNRHRRRKEIDSGSDSDSDYDRRNKRRRHRRRNHRERRSVLSSGSESTDSSSDEERRRRRRKHQTLMRSVTRLWQF